MKNLPLAARLYLASLFAATTIVVIEFAPRPFPARGVYWALTLVAASVYVAFGTYRILASRLDDHRRHVQEMSDLHLATIEALTLAIDAKDEFGQRHARRMQAYAAGLAKAM